MNKSFAIIGNSPSALEYEIGGIIDNSDEIIRINNYQLSDSWTKFIGSKTTIYATNLFHKEVNKSLEELRADGVEAIWSTIPRCRMLRRWAGDWRHAEKHFGTFLSDCIDLKTFTTVASALPRPLALLIYQLIRVFSSRAYAVLQHGVTVPSSGLVAICLAIEQAPEEITITGFDFFSQDRAHYFSDKPPPDKTHHKFAREPDILATLFKQNRHIRFNLALPKNIYQKHFSAIENARRIA